MAVFAGDRALLDAFRAGDRAALATVYFRYVDDIAAIARNGFVIPATGARVRGATDDQTERDIVQEVFSRAFAPRAREAYDGVRPYALYLRRIAKNLMIDRARTAGHAVAVELDDAEIAVEPEVDEIDEQWLAQRRETTTYIAGLAPDLQQLVKLRFEDELSQEDTAKALGVSRRRVRTLEARIQRGLRKALRRAGLWQEDRPAPALVRMGSR
jgi:RNA polymerase sigma factor (sigma-70 family)